MNTFTATSKSGRTTTKNSKRVYTHATVGTFIESSNPVRDEVLTWHGDAVNAEKSANVLRGRGFTKVYVVPVQEA